VLIELLLIILTWPTKCALLSYYLSRASFCELFELLPYIYILYVYLEKKKKKKFLMKNPQFPLLMLFFSAE